MHAVRKKIFIIVASLIIVLVGFQTANTFQQQEPAPTEDLSTQLDYKAEPLYRFPPSTPSSSDINDTNATLRTRLSWSKIAFQSYRHGSWDIYYSNDSDSTAIQLTDRNYIDIQPDLNRGNTHIVYSAEKNDSQNIAIIDLATKVSQNLTLNSWDEFNPAWSPNGSQIIFESYQHGTADIYIMNADGKNIRRLTNNPDFDGMPAWSPDGQYIYFSSRRNGGYRIYRMNADGSHQIQLNNTPYSLRPIPSPDGTKILFDGRQNVTDTYQRAFIMNADGSDLEIKTDDRNYDTLVNSWSPDGQYWVSTDIYYTTYQGREYINTSTSISDATGDKSTSQLLPDNLDFYVAWQTSDTEKPTTSVQLKPVVPGAFQLLVRGQDKGGAGYRGYNLQVREGTTGNWQNIAKSVANPRFEYTGIGGTTYYFRAQAVDNAWNKSGWTEPQATTVESQPPIIHMQEQPSYVQNHEYLRIDWEASDPNGAGIDSFDLQYRINGSDWVEVMNKSGQPDEPHHIHPAPVANQTIEFRIRALDKAQNLSDWIYTEPITSVSWTILRQVFDNTHTPIANTNAYIAGPSPIMTGETAPSVNELYNNLFQSSLDISWGKDGYGRVPTSTFETKYNYQSNIILPPADNLIINGSFEEPPSQGWHASSTLTNTSESLYAGQSGLQSFETTYHRGGATQVEASQLERFMGNYNGADYYYKNHYNNWPQLTVEIYRSDAMGSFNLELIETYLAKPIEVDETLVLYAANITNNGDIILRMNNAVSVRKKNGPWQTYFPSFGSTTASHIREVQIDHHGGVHITWTPENLHDKYYYTYVAPNGVMSNGQKVHLSFAETFPDQGYYSHQTTSPVGMFVYGDRVYIFAKFLRDVGQIWWTQKSISDKAWEPWQPFTPTQTTNIKFEQSPHGPIHIFTATSTDPQSISYSMIVENGTAYTRADAPFMPDHIGEDSNGTVHIVNYNLSTKNLSYANMTRFRKNATGEGHIQQWSVPEIVYTNNLDEFVRPRYTFSIDATDRLHLLNLYNQKLYHMYREADDNSWTEYLAMNTSIYRAQDHRVSSAGELSSYARIDNVLYSIFAPPQSPTATNHTISQVITIPVTMTHPVLSFMYRGGSLSENNSFTIDVSSQTLSMTDVITNTDGYWTHYWSDLSMFSGETVTLTFSHQQAANAPYTWLHLDEINLGSTYSDLFIDLESYRLWRSDQVIVQIPYGNRGGAPANNVVLTATIPADLALISTSLPPTRQSADNTNHLIWSWPELNAKETDVIELIFQAASTAPSGIQTIPIEITGDGPESQSNNSRLFTITIEPFSVGLPIIASD